MCEHPLSDITIAGEAVNPLPGVFHTFLQTISDVMMHLPNGSSLQVNYFTDTNGLGKDIQVHHASLYYMLKMEETIFAFYL